MHIANFFSISNHVSFPQYNNSRIIVIKTNTNMNTADQSAPAPAFLHDGEGIEIVARHNRIDHGRADPETNTGIQVQGENGFEGAENPRLGLGHGNWNWKSKYKYGAVVILALVVAGTGISIWSSRGSNQKFEMNHVNATKATKSVKSAKTLKSKTTKALSSEPSSKPSNEPSFPAPTVS